MRRIQQEEGAVVVEALALVALLLVCLIAVVLVGSAYWNLVLLNTTAQTASLTGQTLMEGECSPNNAESNNCQDHIRSVVRPTVDRIVENSQRHMISVQPRNTDSIGNNNLLEARELQPTSCEEFSILGWDSNEPGWGYSYVRLGTEFVPFGSRIPITIRAGSLSASYRREDTC